MPIAGKERSPGSLSALRECWRDGAPYALTNACDTLIRDISQIGAPTILDVIHVSEQLIQMEMNVARMRNQYAGRKDEL